VDAECSGNGYDGGCGQWRKAEFRIRLYQELLDNKPLG
jgi:hypothetical protein